MNFSWDLDYVRRASNVVPILLYSVWIYNTRHLELLFKRMMPVAFHLLNLQIYWQQKNFTFVILMLHDCFVLVNVNNYSTRMQNIEKKRTNFFPKKCAQNEFLFWERCANKFRLSVEWHFVYIGPKRLYLILVISESEQSSDRKTKGTRVPKLHIGATWNSNDIRFMNRVRDVWKITELNRPNVMFVGVWGKNAGHRTQKNYYNEQWNFFFQISLQLVVRALFLHLFILMWQTY